MPDNGLLLAVFLLQVLFLSGFLPWRLLRNVNNIVATYPPNDYGKLYPVSDDAMRTARRQYQWANLMILLLGIGLVGYHTIRPATELLDWDSQSVIVFFAMMQFLPWIIVVLNPGFTFFNTARRQAVPVRRVAELKRRRLFDYVSPWLVWLAVVCAVACFALILIAPQLWGAGRWNMLFVLALVVFFSASVFAQLNGRRRDPYQSIDDRERTIAESIRLTVVGSIAAIVFLVIAATLQSSQSPYTDVATSIYLTVFGFLALSQTRPGKTDFSVYRGPRQEITGSERRFDRGLTIVGAGVAVIAFMMCFIAYEHRDQRGVTTQQGAVGSQQASQAG